MSSKATELVGIEHLELGASAHRFYRHSHDEYSIIVVTSGRKLLRAGTEAVTVHPGQVIVIPPGTSHDCEPIDREDWSFRSWYLSPELLAKYYGHPELGISPPRINFVNNQPEHAELLGKNPIEKNYGLEVLNLLSRVLENAAPSIDDNRRISGGARLRMDLYSEAALDGQRDLGLDALAEIGKVSTFQVIRDFKMLKQMTPMQYLNNLKLKRAKKMMLAGASLTEIAYSLDFSDQSHFNRRFKRVYGVSPGHYRRLLIRQVKK